MRTRVLPLRPQDAHQAYALLHLVDGSCTLKEWLTFVHGACAEGAIATVKSGAMVARGPDERILGLFAYKTSVGRPAQRMLIVHHFVAFDPFNHGATAHSLLDAMDKLAAELSCEAIRLELSPSHLRAPLGPLRILPDPVMVAGYAAAGVNAMKDLGGPGGLE